MKNILIVLGTRPEAIKLAPVILKLKQDKLYNVLVCNTEQQKELSNQTLAFFNIKADFNLDTMKPNQTLANAQSAILSALSEIYNNNHIDATIVQGDTMTVFCGALVSYYNKVPVFHVEAGLRSYNLYEPFPEEAIRQMTTRIASLHFAPTVNAQKALLQEGICADNIFVTGNTVIDALKCLKIDIIKKANNNLTQKGIFFNDNLVLVTVHRRENHGFRLDNILQAISKLAQKFQDHQFVLPVHPNPNVKNKVYKTLDKFSNIILTTPLDYPELVSMMKTAKLILTDSGGIQEEAPTFGVPVLITRYETERKEGINSGFAKLVGADEDRIITEASAVLSLPKTETRKNGNKNPYGNGNAADAIRKAINDYFQKN